jgi:hypothetical protein
MHTHVAPSPLLRRLFQFSPAIPVPASFGVVTPDSVNQHSYSPNPDHTPSVLVCLNELARDTMGQTFHTTRSVLDTPENRRALTTTAGRPEFDHCGAAFTRITL